MANPEHVAILKSGVEEWNRWREENPGIRPDLEGADLGAFDIVLLNSRDHPDPFGKRNVSRLIIGGTIADIHDVEGITNVVCGERCRARFF